jgi:hypothetical protein
MFWRPSLCIVFLQARKQITNKYTEIIAVFLFCAVFSGEDFATYSFYAIAPGLLMESVDGIRILL